MRKILILLMSLSMAANSFAQEEKAILDGKSFKIDILEKSRIGKGGKMIDVITFKNGKVSTKFSRNNGFPDATYTTTTKDGLMSTIITFKAESKGKKDKLVWEGSIDGDEIEGVATKERKGTIRTMYEFTGTLK